MRRVSAAKPAKDHAGQQHEEQHRQQYKGAGGGKGFRSRSAPAPKRPGNGSGRAARRHPLCRAAGRMGDGQTPASNRLLFRSSSIYSRSFLCGARGSFLTISS